jgi:diguanylate cyclase (GGDEF)-like protein/PAS domain S-box-containing protein
MSMRFTLRTPLLITLLAVVVLALMIYQGQRVDKINETHSEVMKIALEAHRIEADLDREVVNLHAAHFHNFDTVHILHRKMRRLLESLRSPRFALYQSDLHRFDYALDQLIHSEEIKYQLVNHLLRDVSIYKNSVSFVSNLENHFLTGKSGELLEQRLLNLQRRLLAYIITRSDADLTTISEQIDAIRGDWSAYDAGTRLRVDRLLKHGEIILGHKSDVEPLVRQASVPSEFFLNEVVNSYLAFHEEQERRFSIVRLFLYVTSALLLIYLAFALIRLRMTTSTLIKEQEGSEVTLASIGDAVISLNRNGQIKLFNHAAEELTGWKQDEVKQKPWQEVLHFNHQVTGGNLVEEIGHCLRFGGEHSSPNNMKLVDRNGQLRDVAVHVTPVKLDNDKPQGAVIVCRDTTQSESLLNEISYQSEHDNLTSLYNRHALEHRLNHVLEHRTYKLKHVWLFYFGIDSFNVINANCGYTGGDEVLRLVAGTIEGTLNYGDIAARMGGDEFAVLIYTLEGGEGMERAYRLREQINAIDFVWNGQRFYLDVSIGVVLIDDDDTSFAKVLSGAQSALKAAKGKGRNQVHAYDESDREVKGLHDEMRWVPRILNALDEGRYELFLQPIATACQGAGGEEKFHHYEVLVRMFEGKDDMVYPGLFVPIAERYNLSPQLDRWVVKRAMERLAEERQAGRIGDDFNLSINLSGITLEDGGFFAFVRSALQDHNVPARMICFEITETAAVSSIEVARHFIRRVKELGCRFAIDDFGKGASSFSYLHELPVDYLKIDGIFIRDIINDQVSASIVEAIHRVAKANKLTVIAEFVENDTIRQHLCDIGIDLVQGYGVGMPQSWESYLGQS